MFRSRSNLYSNLNKFYSLFILWVEERDYMKRISLALLILELLLSSIGGLFAFLVRANPDVIRVPADFSTIQEAINVASPGSTILVSAGSFYEQIVVNKTLTIIGQDKSTTTLKGLGTAAVLTVRADDVTIDGFTIGNSHQGVEGICIYNSQRATVTNVIVGSMSNTGIVLIDSNESRIQRNGIFGNGNLVGIPYGGGVELVNATNNLIDANVFANNVVFGIHLYDSENNTISKNVLSNSGYGIIFSASQSNTAFGNMIVDNFVGILLEYSNSNILYDNGFINNAEHVRDQSGSNVWNNQKNVGNYWDNYVGLDDGSNSRVAGDGVGDTGLPHLNVDDFPLICPPMPIPVVWENISYPVMLLSNSTISTFCFAQNDRKTSFNVIGPANTTGYCNLTISKSLLQGSPWTIMLDNTDITAQLVITENQTHTNIHFTYNHSTHTVQIIGTWVIQEYSSFELALSLLTLILVATVLQRKRRPLK